MKIKEQLKKLYNKLDFATVGLDNRIIAAHGLNVLLAILSVLILPAIGIIVLPLIVCLITILIGIIYFTIKIITGYLAPKFKMPNPNISIYFFTALLFTCYCSIIIMTFQILTFIILGFLVTILLLKTPFLPECKLKTFQEKLEKNIIKISFIIFIIMFTLNTIYIIIFLGKILFFQPCH